MILVTGGAGFIGANFIHDWLAQSDEPVINLDKLTYAGNLENLAALTGDPRYRFVRGDIGDSALVSQLLAEHQPRAIINFAAESHVDRSIHGPGEFIQTNMVGTYRLLDAAREYWSGLPTDALSPGPSDGATSHSTRSINNIDQVAGYPACGRTREAQRTNADALSPDPSDGTTSHSTRSIKNIDQVAGYPSCGGGEFRFLHVSTDEVYGSLGEDDPPFAETNRYEPNSPYSASKAASDHLVRAWHHTYGLPVLTTNCSNNYGPFHFPEKLIPLVIHNALAGKALPIYGDGQQVRDWLYVKDHCSAIRRVLEAGRVGETYNIGGWNEKPNLEVVGTLCTMLDELQPRPNGKPYAEQMTFVKDRPGHDRRYAIDAHKIEQELGWRPVETFESGIRKTVQWYLDHQDWVANVTSGAYREWVDQNYGARP